MYPESKQVSFHALQTSQGRQGQRRALQGRRENGTGLTCTQTSHMEMGRFQTGRFETPCTALQTFTLPSAVGLQLQHMKLFHFCNFVRDRFNPSYLLAHSILKYLLFPMKSVRA